MAIFTSDQVTNKKYNPGASPHSAREVHCVSGKVSLTAALALNDLAKLVAIPGDCIPVDCVLISDDLDTDVSPTIVIDVGILNADENGLVASSELIDGSTVAQAGGTARMDSPNCAFEPATWLAEADAPEIHEEKIVALKVVTAATTPAAGDVYFELFYRSAENGL